MTKWSRRIVYSLCMMVGVVTIMLVFLWWYFNMLGDAFMEFL